MAVLPRARRAAIVLKTWNGLTFEAIGRLLKISPTTAAGPCRYRLQKLSLALREEPLPAGEPQEDTVPLLEHPAPASQASHQPIPFSGWIGRPPRRGRRPAGRSPPTSAMEVLLSWNMVCTATSRACKTPVLLFGCAWAIAGKFHRDVTSGQVNASGKHLRP